MPGLSVKLPVQRDPEDGYSLTKTYQEMVSQNLKHLILTFPGERVMDPVFGVGLKKFLFEPNMPTTYGDIEAKIRAQVERYLPFVIIGRVLFSNNDDQIIPGENENFLRVRIEYYIKPLDSQDVLDISVSLR